MDNRPQTPTQEPSASINVARTSDETESIPLGDSSVLPNDMSHNDLSSGTECAADATNEPQPNGSPDVALKSTAEPFAGHDSSDENGFDIGHGRGLIDNGNNESIVVFDQSDTDASSAAASDFSIDRDDESEVSATSDFIDDRDDESTLTVASENRKVDYIYGRGYQAGHEYCWPNDEQQCKALDILHHAFLVLLNDSLCFAPIKENVQNVLDVGTGTGIWAIDFADEHPSAQVIGTDISPIQPQWVPPNLEFQIDDANLEWTFGDLFDFIYCRRMVGSIADWVEFTKKASDDKTHEECELIKRWEGFWEGVGDRSGRSFTVVEDGRLEKSMKLAGFTDIKTRIYKMPVGGWPKDPRLKKVGLYTRAALDADLEGLVLRPAVEVLG
ncbi:hypothetical protein CEP54_016169 [Fusarium duplospermum]|uniref:Methyltransferase n=1 Tax=Fusarium duplospermum TaxID=1325734 RepID=A0A428NHK1_9HYPO|nr:hypothetical protein CEP54_016169 [Fusarium duplospermum]